MLGFDLSALSQFDVAVVGAGPAGLIAGHAAAYFGLSTAVLGPAANPADGRTAALFAGSVRLLKRLDLWDELSALAEPLTSIRIIDATGALLRAPEVLFRAEEIDLPAFGYNIANAALTAALEKRASGRLTRILTAGVTGFDFGADAATLTTAEGQSVKARLVAAADGRASPTRTAAGIETSNWSYPQAAVVTTFAHSRPHDGISTEFHRRSGPLTVVPGRGQTSSLVWVETPEEARRLAGLSASDFASELRGHLSGLLGTLSAFQPRKLFPLAGQTALTLAQNRTALIGEAAHVIPPIGAQGLNLSFRDAATLAELASAALKESGDAGEPSMLARYDAARRPDITSRIWSIDLLNRSLLSSLTPVHLARGLGLFMLASFGQLRRSIMRGGIQPDMALPSLMREEAAESPCPS